MGAERPLTSTERSARRRAALRARGLKPRTFWLPDTSTPEFRERAARDCAILREQADRWAEERAFAAALQHWSKDEY